MRRDLSRYAAVLLDLDGTVFQEERALPGAVELIGGFNREGRKYACLSNHTFSAGAIGKRLCRMGVPVDEGHIYTAGDAAADYVMGEFGGRPRVYNLATDSFQEVLEGKVDWVEDPKEACDVVVCGAPLCTHATPDRQRVALELLRGGARLLGICADRVYPTARGVEIGVGALAWMLGYAAGVEPVFTGKPQKRFFLALCERLGVEPGECLLIGDNLESDIAGAKGVGMESLLVLSGVAREEDVGRVRKEMRPDGVIGSLADLV